MAKFCIINWYSNQYNIPGGRRTEFWKKIISSTGHNYNVIHFECIRVSNFKKMICRILNIVFSNKPIVNKKNLHYAFEHITNHSYDYIILCVPAYEVLELLKRKKVDVKYIVDLRDGIYFQSLYMSVEALRYRKWLKYCESLLNDADIFVSNVPVLLNYYNKFLGIPNYLLLNNVNFNKSKSTDISLGKDFNINYFGGLLKSSRGQSILKLIIALNKLNSENYKVSLRMIGRFYIFEKIFYNLLFNNIIWFNELNESEFARFCDNNSVNLLVCTSGREVLPTKLYTYLNFNNIIILLGSSNSLKKVLSDDFNGIFQLGNNALEILNNLKVLPYYKKLITNRNLIDDSKNFKRNVLINY